MLIMSTCIQNVHAVLPLDFSTFSATVYPYVSDNNGVFFTANEVQDEILLREGDVENFTTLQQSENLILDNFSRENILEYFNFYINNPLTSLYTEFTETYAHNISDSSSNGHNQQNHSNLEILMLYNNIHYLISDTENYVANVISPMLNNPNNNHTNRQSIVDDLEYFRNRIADLYQMLTVLRTNRHN